MSTTIAPGAAAGSGAAGTASWSELPSTRASSGGWRRWIGDWRVLEEAGVDVEHRLSKRQRRIESLRSRHQLRALCRGQQSVDVRPTVGVASADGNTGPRRRPSGDCRFDSHFRFLAFRYKK